MEKYLFNDGTNVIREVQSKEELQTLISSSADPAKVSIWVYNTAQWITVAGYNMRFTRSLAEIENENSSTTTIHKSRYSGQFAIPGALKKVVVVLISAAVIFLVYNFTKVSWSKAAPVTVLAARPENTPPVNVDSIIQTIENLRGQKLDKVTRTNLRIRNTWPDLIVARLTAGSDTSREGSRYHDLELMIDNSTGYHIDETVVALTIWKNRQVSSRDTLHFDNIGYASPVKRIIDGTFKGDSISVAFTSARSKAFNFCYSLEKQSNYGNYNDRWFCR